MIYKRIYQILDRRQNAMKRKRGNGEQSFEGSEDAVGLVQGLLSVELQL